MTTTNAPDRPALWPAAFLAGAFLCLVLIHALLIGEAPVDALCLLLLMILWCGVTLAAVFLSIRAGHRNQPRRAWSLAVLPLAFMVTVFQPRLVLGKARTLGDHLHFALERRDYLAQIRALPDTGAPKLMVVGWGGFIVASTSLVYDESDEVTLPPERRSATWKARAEHTDLACPYGYEVRTPLDNHFYAVGVAC
ncbi:hypothetical protein [Nitrospirillum iridis]|uniref:Uncharacterized protein n=1 Tax=Nitrospirillum iridis TaxID=765888 RepID=A0A7X0EF72_9PROT|nr:hypothetical protein [Nitrospirillum iridis]MBB6252781.1 hypothetical protein [Nitrospirillum iridis]